VPLAFLLLLGTFLLQPAIWESRWFALPLMRVPGEKTPRPDWRVAVAVSFVPGCLNTHRVTALKDIGGFAAHEADDMVMTLLYRTSGWRGVYVPLILARGLTPVDWGGYLRQQRRWARSALDFKMRVFPKYAKQLPFATVLLGDFYRQRLFVDLDSESGVHWRATFLAFVKWPYFLLALRDAMRAGYRTYEVTPRVLQQARPLQFAGVQTAVFGVVGAAWFANLASGASTFLPMHVAAMVVLVTAGLAAVTGFWHFPPGYDRRVPSVHRRAPRVVVDRKRGNRLAELLSQFVATRQRGAVVRTRESGSSCREIER